MQYALRKKKELFLQNKMFQLKINHLGLTSRKKINHSLIDISTNNNWDEIGPRDQANTFRFQ